MKENKEHPSRRMRGELNRRKCSFVRRFAIIVLALFDKKGRVPIWLRNKISKLEPAHYEVFQEPGIRIGETSGVNAGECKTWMAVT